jgi:hypothetical protein
MKVRYILLLLVAVLLVVGTGPNLSAQETKGKVVKAADPHIGTFKLNLAKSKIPTNEAPKELTIVVRELGDQYEITQTTIQKDGSSSSPKYTAAKVGGVYKAQPALPEGISLIYTMIDTYDWYTTVLQNGKQVEVQHYVMSKDGKTIAETSKGTDTKGKIVESMAFFDKQ